MYLTVHATIGILIGEHIANPIAAFTLGAVSHFLTDMIPHGDYVRMTDQYGNKIADTTFTMKIIACIDAALMTGMLWILVSPLLFTLSIACAVIGSIAPDFIWGLHETLCKIISLISRFFPNPRRLASG
ncbi:MAG: hypothetical protein WC659_06850 [Patescibacteria group bacterium]